MRRWRHRVLFSFSAFYLFVYMGRFNHWPAGPVIREDLSFTHVDIGIINACLLWGFAIGDFVHGRLAESYGYRFWILIGTLGSVALNWVTSFGTSLWTIAIPDSLAMPSRHSVSRSIPATVLLAQPAVENYSSRSPEPAGSLPSLLSTSRSPRSSLPRKSTASY